MRAAERNAPASPGGAPGIPGGGASPAPSRERWLLSYADFLTLLLALFVVLYASARVDADRSRSLFDGIQSAFLFEAEARQPIGTQIELAPAPTDAAPGPAAADAEVVLLEAVERSLGSSGVEGGPGARARSDERGIVISLASAEFFPAGGVEIPPDRRAVLAGLAPVLAGSGRPLRFEGHTDDQPIESARFPSNWELSSARAAAVARLFIEEHGIEPRRVATAGYAEYRPLVANRGRAERSQNRRVEIVLLRTEEGPRVEAPPDAGSELDRVLDGLPPLPAEVDESLRPADPGPPPADIPLP